MKKLMTPVSEILSFVCNTPGSAFFYTPGGISYFFKNSCLSLNAFTEDEFINALGQIDTSSALCSYGYISYEAGYLLDDRLKELTLKSGTSPLLRFRFFEDREIIKIPFDGLSFDVAETGLSSVSDFFISTEEDRYKSDIKKIREYIAEGDTYQVNYTVRGKFSFTGDAGSFFLSLINKQSAPYTAFINDDENYILSLSPELFFKLKGRKLLCRPMKGTARRGYDAASDQECCRLLKESVKDRAENVMIVDLLRNDMGRISVPGTVKAESLFDIEKYETLFQMTSTVSSVLRKENSNFSGIIKNLFPCGSITGAPKIRTMEIIHNLEEEPRGIYTGTIGIIEKRKMVFNIPIRTIIISKDTGEGVIGLGSGVVWDSREEEEYRETLLKGNFLTQKTRPFRLFTTARVENGEVFLLEEHLKRLKESSEFFVFQFDEMLIRKKIKELLRKTGPDKTSRLKIMLDKHGNLDFDIAEFRCETDEPVKVIISDKRISSKDPFQHFKTTRRDLYDEELERVRSLGYDEVLFFNEDGFLAEGAVSNIFIRKGDLWITPPLSCGVLAGIYRSYFIKNHPGCSEGYITAGDLKTADEVILTNALRKERPAILIDFC